MKKLSRTCLFPGMILLVTLTAVQGSAATQNPVTTKKPIAAQQTAATQKPVSTQKTAANGGTNVTQGNIASSYLKNVQLSAQSTLRLQGVKTVYIDPFNINGEPNDADLILITHPHEDHYSVNDIAKVKKPGTILVVPDSMIQEAKSSGVNQVTTVVPNQSYQEDGVSFKTFPAYNLNLAYHPKSKEWVGYIVQLGGNIYYHAGDTDLLPEMKRIKANVAFLPVGGIYTMNAAEAAQAAGLVRPAVAVPMHYGSVVGTREDAQKFVRLLNPGIKGAIIQKTF